MSMKVLAPDGVKVYHISGGKSLPDWLSAKARKKALRKDADLERRIDLIQDLEFPAACQRLKVSPDGRFVVATGTHPPRVRVYELSELSMKFERHFESEIVDFQRTGNNTEGATWVCFAHEADMAITVS